MPKPNNTRLIKEIKRRYLVKDFVKNEFPDHFRETGNSCCPEPSHEDNNPSLQINKDWAYCHCCRKRYDVIGLYMLKYGVDFNTAINELSHKLGLSGRRFKDLGDPLETYDYTDENGVVLSQVCRFREKKFFQRTPDGKGGYKWGLNGGRRVPYRLPEVMAADLVFITEGEKDANNLRDIGLCGTTNAGGAGNWAIQDKKHGISKPLKDKDVVILADNDEPGRKHAQQVAERVKPIAKSVKIVNIPGLPEKGDPSDYIEMHGKEKAKADILKFAEETPEWEPSEDDENQTPLLGEGGFKPDEFVDAILNEFKVIFHHGVFYRYEHGVYTQWIAWDIKQHIYRLSGISLRRTHYEDIIYCLKIRAHILPKKVNVAGIINLRNGIIDINDPEPGLREHDPQKITTIQLPASWDPKAECPEFLKFLKAKVPDKKLRMTVQEIVGSLLDPTAKYQLAYILLGRSGTGKSTFLHIVLQLVGKENYTAIPLDRLGDRFQTVAIDGKLLNATSEVSAKSFINDGIIKAIIAGDEIMGERKGQDPYRFRPYCKLLTACNELPLSRDTSDALFRRFLVIPFDIQTPPEDYDLELPDRIIANELDGIFMWALAGLGRLKKNNSKFTHSDLAQQAKEGWKREADPVREFCHHFLSPADDGRVFLSTLQRRFNSWAKATKRKSEMTDTTLKKRMIGAGYEFKRQSPGNALIGYVLNDAVPGEESV